MALFHAFGYGSWPSAKLLLLSVALATNLATAVCPFGWFTRGNACYFFSPLSRNWQSARSWCLSQSADLASIHSNSENEWVHNAMVATGIGGIFWLGV